MKQHISTIFLILILIIGLSLLLYPSFTDWWNASRASQAIATYSDDVANLDKEKYDALWEAAWEYNQTLPERINQYLLSGELKEEYDQLLDLSGTGIMGYIEIPALKVSLPVYHGTDEKVLQVAVGHLEWSSLPVGGNSSHCVVSGHRGLPSARLFTDLDKMVEGDLFMFRILDEILTYEVDQIRIVEPHQTEDLLIRDGEDLCTLVTCTPYGVNTHRLLIRGHRVENAEDARIIRVTADALQIEPLIVAPVVAAPILLLLLILLLLPKQAKPIRENYDGQIM